MNITTVTFAEGTTYVTAKTNLWQWDYGQILRIQGLDLPEAYAVHFSNDPTHGSSSTEIGGPDGVQIPDAYLQTGKPVYAFIFLHTGEDDGETEYKITIYVNARPQPDGEAPTPEQQSVIDQLIAALNVGVEESEEAAAAAAQSAQGSAQSAANAAESAQAAAGSATSAESYAGQATTAAGLAQTAQAASEAARDAAQTAQASAESSATSASGSATSAAGSATSAAGSASDASASASSAGASASAASASATTASTAATAAQTAQSAAEDAAEDAQQAAQQAHVEYEQLSDAVDDLSDEVTQQKSAIDDLTALTNRKAGMLVDTASGAIASFVPDSTIPDLLGVSVDIEPQQDLHGYESPWPAGGGVNKFNGAAVTTTHTSNWGIDWNSDTNVLAITRKTQYTTGTPTFSLNLPSGTYVASYQSVSETGQISLYTDGSWVKSLNNGVTFEIDSTKTNEIRFAAVTVTKFQIQSGSTATAYSPYSNICPISGWDAVEVERTGVNLFDKDAPGKQTGWAIDPNTLIAYQTSSGNYSLSDYIPIKGGEPYIASGSSRASDVVFFDANKVGIIGYSSFAPRTAPSNARYLRFDYWKTDEATMMVEVGSTASATYRPYVGNRYTIQIGQTVYGGTLDVTAGTLTVTHGFAEFDGSEDEAWERWQSGSASAYAMRIQISNLLSSNGSTVTAFANYFVGIGSSATWGNYDAFITTTANQSNYLITGIRTITTVAAWKTYLAEHPLQVCYELATPITIQLDPVTIAAIPGQTNNVWADAGDVDVTYAADLKTYIDSKIAAAVAALS